MTLFQHKFSKLLVGLSLAGVVWTTEAVAQEKISRKQKKALDKELKGDRLFVEGQRFMMLEEYEKAFFYFEKALELKPNEGAINFKLAEILARANQPDQALEYGMKAVEADPQNKYYHLLIAEVYSKKKQPQKSSRSTQVPHGQC